MKEKENSMRLPYYMKQSFNLFLQVFLVVFVFSFLGTNNPSFAQNNSESVVGFEESLELFRQEKYEESRILLESLVKQYPFKALFWFNLGNTNFKLKRFSEARKDYDQVISLKSPLAPIASFYSSKCFRLEGNFSKAWERLISISKDALPSSLLDDLEQEKEGVKKDILEKVLEAYRKQNHSEVLQWINLIAPRERTMEMQVMEGLALLHLGRRGEAKKIFWEASHRPVETLEEISLQKEAILLATQIQKEEKKEGYFSWAYMDVSGGYENNVYGDGENEESLNKPLIDFAGGAGRFLTKNPKHSEKVFLNFNLREFLDLSSARNFWGGLFAQTLWNFSSWTLGFQGGGEYEWIDTDSLLWGPSGKISLSHGEFSSRQEISYSYRRNVPFSLYDYLEGNLHTIQLHGKKRFSKVYLRGMVFWNNEDIGDLVLTDGILPLRNQSYNVHVQLQWPVTSPWYLEPFAQYSFLDFQTRAQPGNETRRDHRWALGLKLTQTFWKGLCGFVGSSYVYNQSTLSQTSIDDKNFQQWELQAGLSGDWLW